MQRYKARLVPLLSSIHPEEEIVRATDAQAALDAKDEQWRRTNAEYERVSKALVTVEQRLDAKDAELEHYRRSIEVIQSSRDIILETFCRWQIEYGEGKHALRNEPYLRAEIADLKQRLDNMVKECVWAMGELDVYLSHDHEASLADRHRVTAFLATDLAKDYLKRQERKETR